MLTRGVVSAGISLCAAVAAAQPCDNAWGPAVGSPAFRGSPGLVQAIKPFGTDLFAAGSFGRSGDTPLANIARWDGAAWQAAGSAPGLVYDLEVYDGGEGPRLYAAGSFRSGSSLVDLGVRRWNGTAWEAIGGPDGTVTDLFVHDDGTGAALYACGPAFTTTSGLNTLRIARFKGGRWSAVGASAGLQNVQPTSMAALPTSSGTRAGLTVAGFPLLSTQNLSRWNGSSWTNDSVGSGFSEVVRLGTFGGQMYASLNFSGGLYRVGGSLPSWTPLLNPFTYQGTVYAMHAHSPSGAGTLVLGGDFDLLGVAPPSPSVLASFDGTTWRTIHPVGWQDNPLKRAGSVRSLATTAPGALAFGGTFDGVRQTATDTGAPLPPPTVTLNSIGLWDGAAFSPLGEGLTNPGVRAILRTTEAGREVLYVGGSFRRVGTQAIAYLAKFDGTDWSAPIPGLDGAVRQIVPYAGGIVVCGDFTRAGPQPVLGIARLDASGVLASLPSTTTRVNTIAAGMVNGVETLFAGTAGASGSLVRLNQTAWITVQGGGTVNDIAIAPDGLSVCYTFVSSSLSRLYRWNSVSSTEITFPGSINGSSYQKLAWLGSTLYMSGQLLVSSQQGNLARVNGTTLSLVSNTPFTLNDLVTFDDGSGPRLFGATRTQLADGPASVVSWNGAAWERVGDFDRDVFALDASSTPSEGSLLVGGDFIRVDSLDLDGLAVYTRCPFCGADINHDARVDADDVITFFQAWDTGDPVADFDASGAADGDDTIAFFDRWDGGC